MSGCPKCGNADIQVMELLTAWNEIERLEALLKKADEPAPTPVGFTVPSVSPISVPEKPEPCLAVPLTPEDQGWKDKYEAIKAAYVRTRLEVSGSFGNWDFNTRKRVLEHEISSELGFTV